jgi:quinol monooxygenase YgiN
VLKQRAGLRNPDFPLFVCAKMLTTHRAEKRLMSVLIVNMTARPEKQRELLQTLRELTEAMRQEPGFRDARISIAADNENLVTFTQTWTGQQEVDAYMQHSRYFQVLRGAIQILTSSSEINIRTRSAATLDRRNSGMIGTLQKEGYDEKITLYT